MRMKGEHLFVYGTLLLRQIMQQVTRQRHFFQPAILPAYARYQVRGKAYPGIVREENANVTGILYLNISPAAWQRLDFYEDRFYHRQRVQVDVGKREYLNAWTYIIPESKTCLLTAHDWSLMQFQRRHLQGFLRHMDSRRHY